MSGGRSRRRSWRPRHAVLLDTHKGVGSVFRILDTSTCERTVSELLQVPPDRGASTQHARLAHQFVQTNQDAFAALSIIAEPQYRGDVVTVRFRTGSTVGAVPLICPRTGQPVRGVVVEPRFGWRGVGPPMAATGWRVTPSILRMPLLPKSARDIPVWLIATTVLTRIDALLRTITRRFGVTESILRSPRGRPLWQRYASKHWARGHPERVPCRYVDLDADQPLLAALHFVLARQQASLEAEARAGHVAAQVLRWCVALRQQVEHVAA